MVRVYMTEYASNGRAVEVEFSKNANAHLVYFRGRFGKEVAQQWFQTKREAWAEIKAWLN